MRKQYIESHEDLRLEGFVEYTEVRLGEFASRDEIVVKQVRRDFNEVQMKIGYVLKATYACTLFFAY
jgi:hypothetical protein